MAKEKKSAKGAETMAEAEVKETKVEEVVEPNVDETTETNVDETTEPKVEEVINTEETTEPTEVKETKVEAKYKKKQILTAKRFKDKVDILHVCLSDEKLYTLAEAEAEMKKFLERKVK